MKSLLFVILALLLCTGITGCKMMRSRNTISQISYTSDSGTILPELQWHEEIIITRNTVSLIRNGKTADTEINEGTWILSADEHKVMTLFEQLEDVQHTTIMRIEPESPLDGGNTETYTIVYGDDKTYSLVYDPGTTYANGELIVTPIKAFIHNLRLPVEAANQYRWEIE